MVGMSHSTTISRGPADVASAIKRTRALPESHELSVKESVIEVVESIQMPPEIAEIKGLASRKKGSDRIGKVIEDIETWARKVKEDINVYLVTAGTLERMGRYGDAAKWWTEAYNRLNSDENRKRLRWIEKGYEELCLAAASGLIKGEGTIAFEVDGRKTLFPYEDDENRRRYPRPDDEHEPEKHRRRNPREDD